MASLKASFSDVVEPGFRVFDSLSSRVILTEPIRSFIHECKHYGERPILFTRESAHLGWFVADELRYAGGYWVVQDSAGENYDANNGLLISEISDLWQPPQIERARLESFIARQDQGAGTFFFDVFARERAEVRTRCGRVAEHMTAGLGGGNLTRWDEYEPLASPWDKDVLTASFQRQMPTTRRHLARSEYGALVNIEVGRTDQGLMEHTRGLVPTGPYNPAEGRPAGELLALDPRITETLQVLGQKFRPNIATIAYGQAEECDGSLGQYAVQRSREVLLAVLIGPPAVREMKIDIEAISKNHDVTPIGLRKAPSLLVRFSKPGDLWTQVATFAHELNLERVVKVLLGLPVDE